MLFLLYYQVKNARCKRILLWFVMERAFKHYPPGRIRRGLLSQRLIPRWPWSQPPIGEILTRNLILHIISAKLFMCKRWVMLRRLRQPLNSSSLGTHFWRFPVLCWTTSRSRFPLRRPLDAPRSFAYTTGVVYSIQMTIFPPWVSVTTSTGLSVLKSRCTLLHTWRLASSRSRETWMTTASQLYHFLEQVPKNEGNNHQRW